MSTQFPPIIATCLKELDAWLNQNARHIEVAIIGATAIQLLGFRIRETLDINTVSRLNDSDIRNKIEEIGTKHGIASDWLNDDASSLTLPRGFSTRLQPVQVGNNISAKVASRVDLIFLKAAAYVSRGHIDPKDIEDLKTLAPTKSEISAAIEFIREHHSPPVNKNPWTKDFEDSLEVLRELV